jgi:LPPG:FO 2-phospho-L-lactate transferase
MQIVALAGGVGGAKLADGLAQVVPPDHLTVIVNTGDDFYHYGLKICTDLDTVCYTLANLANQGTGWGLDQETWVVLESLRKLQAPDWFQLGDRDLATHLERTRLLNAGWTLSAITDHFCALWGVNPRVLPMTNQVVSTKLGIDSGQVLDFQEYFVHEQWKPAVKEILFSGSNDARPVDGTIEAIANADLVVICPSNPLVSVAPILSISGIREAVMKKPVVAVSPIIDGKAVKGPLAKMIRELYDVQPTAAWVAEYYRSTLRLDGYVLDQVDMHEMDLLTGKGIICKPGQTLMHSRLDRSNLAQEVIHLGQNILRRQ